MTLNSIPGLDLLAVAEAQLDAAEREAHEVAEAAGLQEESGDEEEEEEEQQQQPSCAVTEADCSGSATAQRYFRLSHTEVSKVARPCHSMTQLVKEILGIIHRGEVRSGGRPYSAVRHGAVLLQCCHVVSVLMPRR